MTVQDQQLADDKMRAEIAKLMAETSKTLEEASKIRRERFWIPFTFATGLIVAIVTVLPKLIA